MPSVGIDTRQRNLFAECQACSTRQRQHVCRVLTASTRQRRTEGPPPASPEVFCRGLFFAECLTLSKEDICRVFGTRQRRPLPSAALGKLPLCRVPVFRHSAKRQALGKERVSYSGTLCLDLRENRITTCAVMELYSWYQSRST